MKRILTLLALFLALALPPSPALAQDEEAEVNFDYFYEQLQGQGDWFQTEQYGYVFQPKAAGNENWRPYSDGYWSYTDQGWTWVSYEEFGWATYHYGRWAKLAEYGWVWVPGYEWAPAWVSWRTNSRTAEVPGEEPPPPPAVAEGQPVEPPAEDDLIGWAPLPPEAVFDSSVGFTSAVDETYDIGPSNYCFVPTVSFAAPVLTAVIYPVARNVYFIPRTVNCTNLGYYGRGGGRTGFIYCGGPRFRSIERRVDRPIRVLSIQRTPPADRRIQGAPPIHNQVRGNTLQVVAPRITRPPGVRAGAVGVPASVAANVRPANIRGVIPRVDRQRGWENLDPQAAAASAARAQIRRDASAAPPRAAAPQAMPAIRPPREAGQVDRGAIPVRPDGRAPVVSQPEGRNPRQVGPVVEPDRPDRRAPRDPRDPNNPGRVDRSQPSDAVRDQIRRQTDAQRAAEEQRRQNPATGVATDPAAGQRDRAAIEADRRRALQDANRQLRDPNFGRQQAEAAEAARRQQAETRRQQADAAELARRQQAETQAQAAQRAASAQAQQEAAQARIRQQQQEQQRAAAEAARRQQAETQAQGQQQLRDAAAQQEAVRRRQAEAQRAASAQAQQEAAQARIRQQQEQQQAQVQAQREAAAAQQREAAIQRQAQQAEAVARAQAQQREAAQRQQQLLQQQQQQRAQQQQAEAAARAQAQREAAAAAQRQQQQQQQRRQTKPGEPTPAPN